MVLGAAGQLGNSVGFICGILAIVGLIALVVLYVRGAQELRSVRETIADNSSRIDRAGAQIARFFRPRQAKPRGKSQAK